MPNRLASVMAQLWQRINGAPKQQYELLPFTEKDEPKYRKNPSISSRRVSVYFVVLATVLCLYGLFRYSAALTANKSCDTIDDGYRCSPETSHFWGQYSLWFSVPSDIDVEPPKQCDVSFASVLSRHGGRDPTMSKTLVYGATIGLIQNTSTAFPDEFAFLKDYQYTLGADQLTDAGRQEMVNSGAHFYRRYRKFLNGKILFVRSSGQDRVVESANKWLEGYAQAGNTTKASIDISIPESSKSNNTLSHEICSNFEDGPISEIGDNAQEVWLSKFIPPIQARVNGKLGTNLSTTETLYLMDMCPFTTLASPNARMSDFCRLFTEEEWHQYDYYETLGKWYGYGNGNPLGPSQGIGYVSELIARLTEQPVKIVGSINSTLDTDPKTFPLDRKLYADFSHDNDMTVVLAALGLYNNTAPLSNTTIEGTEQTKGYSAAWTVPFAARIYVEKLSCKKVEEEYVRVIVNDRVQPLGFCGGDKYGRCTLSKFVESQSFATSGGHWDQCFSS
ncbi:acid phosphatase [Bimuria novae-zelandiae CBS 107.79]|uniref:Phytase A n=1 Tax=Bimuria novae-zelandiae CBS 107.79 TaxID=1447943 RepID=A0A6A5VTY9_9PLEO|nr:acid phosphatase [Bimuria novae-zelandiae CBS 107.79]